MRVLVLPVLRPRVLPRVRWLMVVLPVRLMQHVGCKQRHRFGERIDLLLQLLVLCHHGLQMRVLHRTPRGVVGGTCLGPQPLV